MGEFYYIKAVHIIFIITWFAGLFYLPRLMVYSAEANVMEDAKARGILLKQYQLMKKRLLYGITWPSAVFTLLLGSRMLMIYPLTDWLKLKLVFVIVLYFYFFSLQRIFTQQEQGNFKWSGQQLRAWNEVPTVLLFAIVFLVVLKNTVDFWWGLAGLAALVILLMSAIKIYKALRKNKPA
ncbi:MAG: protoporphyrinogen IX oxidase [Chitinophagaceae bacterium]|nr:MAG: protoporphyrinogen IX oxidase [Chitinophagaceae bacterium]